MDIEKIEKIALIAPDVYGILRANDTKNLTCHEDRQDLGWEIAEFIVDLVKRIGVK